MSNPENQIESYLPKFYPKSNQISSILNPLLKDIRESKVSSYKQLEQISYFGLQQKRNQSSNITKKHVFTQNHFKNVLLHPYHSQQKQKNTLSFQIPKLSYGQKIFSQNNKIESNQSQFETLDKIKNGRNHSFNLRSKTSDRKKNNKKVSLAPCTADFSRNIVHNSQNRKRFLFDNHKNMSQSFDEQISTYLELKTFVKGPSFSGGKFSKFKKHLVEEINLDEIQKKFYQNPSTMTNYKQFFQKILNRRKHSQMENYSINRKNYKTISQIGKKATKMPQKQTPLKHKDSSDCVKQSLSKTIQIDRPFQSDKNLREDRKRRRSVKAVLFYKKNTQNDELIDNQLCSPIKNLDDIEITGKKKNLLFPKK